MRDLLDKLKERWGVHTYGQLALILFIFAITGMTTLVVRKFAFELIGITETTSYWLKIVAWIMVVFPSYQLLFLFYGLILGQFEFVWRFEKKSLGRIKSLFVKPD